MLCKLFKSLIWNLLFIIILNTVGCGQSGPLYLPDESKKDTETKK